MALSNKPLRRIGVMVKAANPIADILVIDDDPIIRRILQRMLQSQGYRVAMAETAEDGLEQALAITPPVILCDWRLPGTVDGLEICRRLKEYPDLSMSSFLLITAHAETASRVEALEAGADDLLMKPIDMAELKARVKSGMRLCQLTRDLKKQKQYLENELAEAAAYVQSLLPQDTDQAPVKIQTRFLPSQQLGGDCFDFYWLDPDYLVIYLLDVSGHGLGAALLSTSVLNVLRSQSLPGTNFYRPDKVLESLNNMFQMTDQNEKYFTIWYGVYNRVNRQLMYASAGHPPAVLLSQPPEAEPGQANGAAANGAGPKGHMLEAMRLRTPGMPIGMMPDTSYTWKRCSIPDNSYLYIFSDGVYEVPETSVAETGEILGLDSFIDHIVKCPRPGQLDQLISYATMPNLNAAVGEEIPLLDDLSLLEINFG
ncbi:PP2C family protein-serine/threonine phosphatase [Leptothoe sp. PORK10 BA2]|uniref:PP2C family protein-serine/threonine phosphatase n=1 Tax=Leptothoe sp. PORK10 BA2 TaxID=3110254 RepID=UPI002B1F9A01|nr:SpoIIE family protein phosphatase [Leptothoe sp. PORK10 BA2]MEA5465097.1 SpoIIE family protein phosphatase [Leptothoe sp. PORK10 BA2]